MDNWFLCESQQISINLNLVSEINWAHTLGCTRVFYIQSTVPYSAGDGGDVPYVDIRDKADRAALRRKIFGKNNWEPK